MALRTFDQSYYLANNPDVLTAVLNGVFASAEEHYIQFGEREGRQPSAYFDPAGYLVSNPDVFAAVQSGVFSTGLEHFENFGVFEGRAPGAPDGSFQYDETYYLDQNPDVAAAVADGTFSSGYEHFVLFGADEGRAPAEGVEPGTPGDTFTLTVDQDILTGTVNDDIFRAPSTGLLQSVDQIDGLGGNDTLTGVADAGQFPLIKGVENFFLTGQFEMNDVSDAQQVWAVGGALAANQGTLNVIYGLKDAGASIAVDVSNNVSGTSDTLNTAIDDTNGVGTLTSADAAGIENLTVLAAGAGGSGTTGDAADDVLVANTLTALKSVTVTGDGNTEVQVLSADLETVDTTGANGRMTVNGAASTKDMTMTGGSGDTVFSGGAGKDAITTGAGKDNLFGQAGDDVLTGGANADNMTGGAGNDTFMIEAGFELGSQDTVLDFAGGADKYGFGGPAGSGANYAENAVVNASFNDAREAANALLNGTVVYAAVEIAGSGLTGSVVFYDSDADGTADQAVNLAGVTTAGLADDGSDIIA